jgi:hypothetical protein
MSILKNGIVTISAIATACSQTAAFQPTEPAEVTSPSGQPAAAYDIRAEPDTDPRIHVNVWSEGAARDDDRTHVDLAFEIRNTGDQPVTLDRSQLALEAFNSAGAQLPSGQLVGVSSEGGALSVAPGSAQTIKLRYELPPPASPNRISSLRLRWGLVRPGGERYLQFTEFRRKLETPVTAAYVVYDPVFGLYDPFFYPPPLVVHRERVVPVGVVVVHDRRRAQR